ncbi:MAG: hypothetical protein MZW92_59535 [Comamonadaceae bacterium]|nr:hypothetical protein [Comamonadaceae bacterium]
MVIVSNDRDLDAPAFRAERAADDLEEVALGEVEVVHAGIDGGKSRHPPRADARLQGLGRRRLRQHSRRPGIGDKTAVKPARRNGARWKTSSATSSSISRAS